MIHIVVIGLLFVTSVYAGNCVKERSDGVRGALVSGAIPVLFYLLFTYSPALLLSPFFVLIMVMTWRRTDTA
ncbi:hypothetical protein [Pontibacillus sp. HN14]|nr:hypothetical protein [Pontibacillus sp. HN14]